QIVSRRRRPRADPVAGPGAGALLGGHGRVLPGPRQTPDRGRAPVGPAGGSSPRAGRAPGLALEGETGPTRRWHDADPAGHPREPTGLSATAGSTAGRRLPHHPPGAAVVLGDGRVLGRGLRTLPGQGDRRDGPVAAIVG